ncbi:unnamed protein product [Triticum turgidum subsp. durum]|uniref:Uncharacterized protein n=1 Tax=Triticum turgidum subsp. durum TaxID=4567 RepID=A0A9R0Q075_TRITD|nr:unnamed protein product [Triticum turgidum subsp. durum]
MSMEPSWIVPCDSGWSMEEAAAAWSSEDRISFQTSLPSHSDSVQLQMVEYASPSLAPATHDNDSSYPIQVFEEAVEPFRADYSDSMEWKMHKVPPSLIDVFPRYKEPLTVAIGPYHHGAHPGLLEAERMKHVAATQCMRESTRSLQEMYNAVFFVLPDARNLYHQDNPAKFRDDNFLPMMFLDACFLVQYMRWYYVNDDDMDEALNNYFFANYEHICTDIMKLENQIPWVVVQAIFHFMPAAPASPWPWEDFVIAMRRGLKNQTDDRKSKEDGIVVVPEYKPPHLLGLVWFYVVGKDEKDELPLGNRPISLSMSVAELDAVGITFKPEAETEEGLVDMGLHSKPPFFGVLSVPPLCLTDRNATWLVNMAAFELCRASDFDDIADKNSDVCSYLQLFVMLLDQERHVHDLRAKGVIQGGGLTSKETLEFFTLIGKNMRYEEVIWAQVVPLHYQALD